MKKNLPLILLIGLTFLSIWQIADRISAQQQPLTLAQLLTGLQTKGPNAETNTLTKRNIYLAKLVRQRKVSFTLNAEREKDLREAGATDELIEAIRQNSLRLQTPTQTPITKSTPTVSGREIKNSIGMEFVRILSGSFMMGSPASEKYSESDERPQHRVIISRDFYLGKYEVTQGQWKAVMGNNPSSFSSCGDNCPVEQVSWNDVQEFIRKLNAKNEATYRLPTEAEWEYAARGGTPPPFGIGDGYNLSPNEANFDGNYPYGNAAKGKYLKMTVAVGSYQPNAWGLYDMNGNVSEWCQDWSEAYSSSAQTDPIGPSSGSARVLRGGSWFFYGWFLRSARRSNSSPSSSYHFLGFRLIKE